MNSEKDKMLSGKAYKAMDAALTAERKRAKELCYQFNQLPPSKLKERKHIIRQLGIQSPKAFYIEPPFYCDYGYNISIGENFYSNHGLVILDCAPVHIGKNVLIGPQTDIYTAGHPLDAVLRNEGWEHALPVTIGDNVWIGGNVVINPGISIGDNTVIGSGSVVTKDIPSGCIAVGNPCKVLRAITEEDKNYYFE